MSAVSPITRQTVGRTFIVAISVLGIGALAQFSVILWFQAARFHNAPPAPESVSFGPKIFADPFADAPSLAPSQVSIRPNLTPPKPTPVSQQALAAATVPTEKDRFNELIQQAKTLREQGDTYAAVNRLREAEAFDPRNPQAPGEIAITYEKMGAKDKAAEAWRRVLDMGEDAGGIYFQAALGRRDLQAQRDAASAAPADGAAPELAAAAPTATGPSVGLGPNCKLGFGAVSRRDETDPTASRKFTLLLPVMAKPRARIDVPDVIVQVMFYDVVNGKALDHTSAQVSYKWSSPPADWSETDVETLEVSYFLPAQHVSDEDRKYYGYIASLYYKNALQDFRSDPPALADRLKPKRVLSAENE